MNNGPEEKEARIRLWLRRTLWVLLGALAAGLLGGAALLFRMGGLSNGRAYAQAQERVPVYSQAQIDKLITNVLVVVQNDVLGSKGAQGDMLFIVSFNALEQRLTVVSLLREMLLQVAGQGELTLGDIYAQGGPGLLVNTVNESLNMDLQSYVCTDTHSLAKLIDLLGGVEAALTAEEAQYIREALHADAPQAGQVRLSGTQSMVHALNGVSGEGTFGRAARQLALVESAVADLRISATKDKMIPLLAAAFNSFYTNLDIQALRDIGYEILRSDDMEYNGLILPCAGSWTYETVNGVRCVRADAAQNAALLHERLYGAANAER